MVAIHTSISDLEARAIHMIGSPERRLFLMDGQGIYWVRPDMTAEEAMDVADTLASWWCRDSSRFRDAPYRLYDDGGLSPRF